MINLKRFIDIDIQPHVASTIISTRNTVVLFTPEGTLNTVNEFSSLDEVTYEVSSLTYKYLQVFFDNGGVKARVIEGVSYTTLTKEMITNLDNDFIYIACASSLEDKTDSYAAMKTLATSLNSDTSIYGINEKIILSACNVFDDDSSIKNFAVKYSSVVGAEMTMAAYLSKLNIDALDSVQDYAFTEENLVAENLTDTQFGQLQSNNINVDINLSGAVRNCGGNNKDGSDFINDFVRILVHQTLTGQLINLLTQKLKSTDISKIYATITQELERYRNCGYLTTDKVWTDNDLKVTRNNVTYTIISKGDALLNGYRVTVLPLAALTDADRASRTTPPIYIILADQYGIRKITINGEVI